MCTNVSLLQLGISVNRSTYYSMELRNLQLFSTGINFSFIKNAKQYLGTVEIIIGQREINFDATHHNVKSPDDVKFKMAAAVILLLT